MFNPTETAMSDADNYLAIDVSPETPQALAERMVRAILVNRGPDNGSDGGNINHIPEELTTALFNAICSVLPETDTPMSGNRVCIFHLCHGFSRVLVSALEGKVLWDKIVDHGGWAQVLADRNIPKPAVKPFTLSGYIPPSFGGPTV